MSTENVTWIAGSAAPVAAWNGATKSVQTYCGLEIDIIAIKPRPSWIHLVAGTAWARTSPPPADASLTDAMPPCLPYRRRDKHSKEPDTVCKPDAWLAQPLIS